MKDIHFGAARKSTKSLLSFIINTSGNRIPSSKNRDVWEEDLNITLPTDSGIFRMETPFFANEEDCEPEPYMESLQRQSCQITKLVIIQDKIDWAINSFQLIISPLSC